MRYIIWDGLLKETRRPHQTDYPAQLDVWDPSQVREVLDGHAPLSGDTGQDLILSEPPKTRHDLNLEEPRISDKVEPMGCERGTTHLASKILQ